MKEREQAIEKLAQELFRVKPAKDGCGNEYCSWNALLPILRDRYMAEARYIIARAASVGYRLVPELKVLTDLEIGTLTVKWQKQYEDLEMTDAEWDAKRDALLVEAQRDYDTQQINGVVETKA